MQRSKTPPLPHWSHLALITFAILLLVALFLVTVVKEAAGAPAPKPLGVWYQSVDSFPTWKARGVTLLVGWESEGGTVSVDKWCKAAADAGLDYVLQSENPDGTDAGTAAHWNDPHCAAVEVSIDEFNQNNARKVPPTQLYVKALAIRQRTAKPIFGNLDGSPFDGESDAELWGYVHCLDWVAFDVYPINNGRGWDGWAAEIPAKAARLKRLGAATLLIAVESSDQNLRVQDWIAAYPKVRDAMRGPTPEEVARQLATVRALGATPFLFPDKIGKWFESRDGTDAATDGALRALSATP